jgi:uncharacterized protein YndB with AHSA1/START domain
MPGIRIGIVAAGLLLGLLAPGMAGEEGEAVSDRVIHKEVIVQATLDQVWHAWTTAEGLQFVSPESNVELRPGGPYEWFLHLEPDAHGKRGGQGARILEFTTGERLVFDWTFPPSVPTLRESGAKTRVEVRFEDLGDGTVHVDFMQSGWGEGEDWDAGYAYFDEAWGYVLNRLKEHFEPPPAE